jgi:glucose-fructose oxidoreductase
MRDRRLSRRTLLKGAAGAIAVPALIPSSAIGADGATPPSDRVNLGHIGVGGQGTHLFNSFQKCKGAQSVAVADCFKDRRESRAQQCGGTPCADLRELLARKDVDGVVIATQDHWHVVAALLAVRAGKDVYVEKPLGISVLHDQTLRKEVRERKRIFQYGTQQRSQNQQDRKGCELVRSGKIGKITELHVTAPNGASGGSTDEIPVPPGLDYDMWLGPAPKAPYTKDRCTNQGTYHIYDYALGFIAGWGAHPLDQLVWGYDVHKAGITEVEGTGRIPDKGLYNTVLDWDVRLAFANGVKMTFKPGGDNTRFVGTEGSIEVSRGTWKAEPASLKDAELGANDVHLVDSRNHYQNFVDCIKTRKDPVSFIEDAVRSDIISHLGDIAIRLKRKIRWDWEKEEILGDPEASKMLSRPLRAPWTL